LSLDNIPIKSLKEVTSYLSRGITPSYTEEDGVLVLNQRCIRDNKIIWDNVRLTDPNKKKIGNDKYLKKFDVLVNSTGVGTLGRTAQIKELSSDTTVDSHVTILRPNDLVDPLFFGYAVKSVEKNIESLAEGSTGQTELSRVRLGEEIFINLHPKNIQMKIANILSYIDEKIYLNEKMNKNLEEQLSLIFDDYFVKCSAYDEDSLVKTDWGKIPKEWKNIDFGELIQIASGDRPDEKSETKTAEFNIPLFGASKIMGYTKEYSYNEDILIIGRVGTHGVVQRVNYPCFPSDNTFVIKSKYYGFVYQLLKRIDYDSLNTGSTQPLITQKSLKTVNVVLPDEKLLSEFENISKVFFDKIYLNQNEITSLTRLRDTLLPKLMSGEIDVSKINCDLD